MADPTTSAQPVVLAGTDNWFVSSVGALVRGIKNVGDWIAGLSPAGASVYDTGWVTAGFTPQNGSTWGTAKIRRVGNTVTVYVVSLVTSSIAVATNGNCTNTPVMTVPSGFAPAGSQALSGVDTTLAGLAIGADGSIVVCMLLPPVTATTTTTQSWTLTFGGTYFLG